MKIIVIPDVHLKPWMFTRADNLLRHQIADLAVCLMDIPDDWDKEFDVALYAQTYEEAIRFAKRYPDTRWCYGNHDLCYPWHKMESGYSSMASFTVQRKLLELRTAVPKENPIRYVHRIDNVIFSHGGVLDDFVRAYVRGKKYDDVDAVLETINGLGPASMWNVISCDVFSTYQDGRPIGTEEFLLIDTKTWAFTGVKG